MKKLKVLVLCLLLFVAFDSVTNANVLSRATNRFWIDTGGNRWTRFVRHASKTNNLNTSSVNWTYTVSARNHNQWFRVVTPYGDVLGTAFIKGAGNQARIRTNARRNRSYALESKREFFRDPATMIYGTWTP